MKLYKPDYAEIIHYLTVTIKKICEENNLPKQVIITDFEDLMNAEFEKRELDSE